MSETVLEAAAASKYPGVVSDAAAARHTNARYPIPILILAVITRIMSR